MPCVLRKGSSSITTLEHINTSISETASCTLRHHSLQSASTRPHRWQDAVGCAIVGENGVILTSRCNESSQILLPWQTELREGRQPQHSRIGHSMGAEFLSNHTFTLLEAHPGNGVFQSTQYLWWTRVKALPLFFMDQGSKACETRLSHCNSISCF